VHEVDLNDEAAPGLDEDLDVEEESMMLGSRMITD
jgi:hypothetical protein